LAFKIAIFFNQKIEDIFTYEEEIDKWKKVL
jgi:DNA-binding XRE family transcriptional regulator